MIKVQLIGALALTTLMGASSNTRAEIGAEDGAQTEAPYVVVLGVAQDGGVPQAGDRRHPGWTDPGKQRLVVSLGLVSPHSGQRWLFDASPDFPRQLYTLDQLAVPAPGAVLDGIFITHAHIGHYTGLMYLGHEVMGARGVPLYVSERMAGFLSDNGPWNQLIRFNNVAIQELQPNQPVALTPQLQVTPFLVPHRQEFSDVFGFRIQGPNRSALFIPDIDSWSEWSAQGFPLAEQLASVDLAYLDATFYADGELPGRDMSQIPHPLITTTMDLLQHLPAQERAKVRFIHMNHSNPALWPDSEARREIMRRGFDVAEQGDIEAL